MSARGLRAGNTCSREGCRTHTGHYGGGVGVDRDKVHPPVGESERDHEWVEGGSVFTLVGSVRHPPTGTRGLGVLPGGPTRVVGSHVVADPTPPPTSTDRQVYDLEGHPPYRSVSGSWKGLTPSSLG